MLQEIAILNFSTLATCYAVQNSFVNLTCLQPPNLIVIDIVLYILNLAEFLSKNLDILLKFES